ncbi:hypothetical protein [Streptosporangium sp. NPDC004631]
MYPSLYPLAQFLSFWHGLVWDVVGVFAEAEPVEAASAVFIAPPTIAMVAAPTTIARRIPMDMVTISFADQAVWSGGTANSSAGR